MLPPIPRVLARVLLLVLVITGMQQTATAAAAPPPFPVLPASFKARLLLTWDSPGDMPFPTTPEGSASEGSPEIFVLFHYDHLQRTVERQRTDFFRSLNHTHLELFLSAIRAGDQAHLVYHRQPQRSPAMCVELPTGPDWYRAELAWSPRYYGRARYVPHFDAEAAGQPASRPCEHWRIRHPLAQLELDLCVDPASLQPLVIECPGIGLRLDVLAMWPGPANTPSTEAGSAWEEPMVDSLFEAQLASEAPCTPLG